MAAHAMDKRISNRQTAEHYFWGDICEGWRLLDRSDLSVIQERVPPGAAEVRHYHSKARQLFFVLDGHLVIELDAGASHQLSSGDALEIEPGVVHQVRNSGSADASFLVISAPTTKGDRVNL